MAGMFEYLSGLFSGIVTKLIVAVIILLVGFIIGRVAGKLIQRVLQEIGFNKILKKAVGIKVSVEELIGSLITYFIYFITVVIALKQIGLATLLLDLLFGAIIILIIVAIFLSIKDFVPNMTAGIFIHQKRNIKEGSTIKVKGIEGEVIHINLVETRIKTESGDTIHIPNSILIKEEVVVRKG